MKIFGVIICAVCLLFGSMLHAQEAAAPTETVKSQDDATIAMIRAESAKAITAFNAGNVDELTAMFMARGEIIDEFGNVYRGETEIKEIMTSLFTRFPGSTLDLNTESVRIVGPVAIEEGTRTITSQEGDVSSQFRYIAVWGKSDQGWRIASHRDFSDDPPPTPGEFLQPLAWLVGEWVNEGSDGRVAISFRWSDDGNYLLGDFDYVTAAGVANTSTQRIAWDANAGRIRSWLFDADGAFSEGVWTVLEEGAVIKSTSVNPDGSTASATLNLTIVDKDHLKYAGTDRIVAGGRDLDFELTIARRPPSVKQ